MMSLAQQHYMPMFGHVSEQTRTSFPDPPRSDGNQRIQMSGLHPLNTNITPYYSSQPASPQSAVSRRSSGGATLKSSARARHHLTSHKLRSQGNESNLSGTDSGPEGKTASPIRRRISRACDQCNQLRTKCDGRTPCAHCMEFGLACEYFRERKKRGKASRKDIAAREAAAAASGESGTASPEYSSEEMQSTASSGPIEIASRKRAHSDMIKPASHSVLARARSRSGGSQLGATSTPVQESNRSISRPMAPDHIQLSHLQEQPQHMASPMQDDLMSMHSFEFPQDFNQQSAVMNSMSRSHTMGHLPAHIDTSAAFHYNGSLQMMSPHGSETPGYPFSAPAMDSSVSSFIGSSPADSPPAWISLPSPDHGSYSSIDVPQPTPNLRYPVLQPVLSRLTSILPMNVACDLLEHYFASSASTYLRPLSPYLLGFVFRKHSILHPSHPRQCTPALLASMLWVAAQTSNAPFLTTPHAARGRISTKLLELTISLLRPLVHGSGQTPLQRKQSQINGDALSELGMPSHNGQVGSESGGNATIDDVVTYIHLATVVSASEHKAASMRWWNIAFSLAREMKLGRELCPDSMHQGAPSEDDDAEGELEIDMHGNNTNNFNFNASFRQSSLASYSEEDREERRRAWWLLYTADRHLALCYNRPLFLLDAECSDLLQPVNDALWQAGDFYTGESCLFEDNGHSQPRHRGPIYECTSHSVFGFFTPLMTILGEIIDLQQARNHPRFGLTAVPASEWDRIVAEITRHLEIYECSLNDLEARCTAELRAEQETEGRNSTSGIASGSTSGASLRVTENFMQTKTAVAYGTHVLHVLHILLTGKWDPISLLDDSDLWISSQSFIFATQHAVSGAEAVAQILEFDSELHFMPFFFGIYLLQGSFLLLLIADKLRADASQSVVSACEVVVRAVDASVVTLSTEYQRHFRNVMRSALAQVKGHIPEDFGEQQQRRREVLALYRWTGDGTGLAL